MLDFVVLVVAGTAAGMLNAVAGGGTFLSLPALIYVGVPPVSANATATLSALPGYAGSAWAYRSEIAAEGALGLRGIVGLAVLGSVLGALLLVVTSEGIFREVVPWLLLAATFLFAAGPRLLAEVKKRGFGPAGPVASGTAVLAVCIYGGYFNGGLGIMLLAVFGLIGFQNLHAMNGMKNALSVVISLVSVVTFVAADLIAWAPAFVVAAAATVGGYLGARLSRRIEDLSKLRIFITAVGIVMSIAFFVSV